MTRKNLKSAAKSNDDSVCTVNAKQGIRTQLEADMEAFLSKGGSIQEVDMHISADPPVKPNAKYGGQPL